MSRPIADEKRDFLACTEHQKHLYRTNRSRLERAAARQLRRLAGRHNEVV